VGVVVDDFSIILLIVFDEVIFQLLVSIGA